MSKGRVLVAALGAATLVLVGAIFVKSYASHPHARGTLQFAAAIIGGGGVFWSVLFGLLTGAQHRVEDRRHRALALIDQLNTRDLVRLRAQLEHQMDGWPPSSPPDSLFRADLVFYLGLLEDLALAIRTKDADEHVLYQSLSHAVPKTFSIFGRFIDYIRDELNDGTIFLDLELLTAKWGAERCYGSRRKMKDAIKAKPVRERNSPGARHGRGATRRGLTPWSTSSPTMSDDRTGER